MIPSMSSISEPSVAVRVDKATSEFLIGPDWALNMDICDMINSDHLLAKDVVKAVKKRLQHKNPKVQLFALTLLEMMVKNCGDYVHFQIAERDILPEMIKIVRKRGYQTDLQVRDKTLTLIDAWNDALGGASNGKYPQYRMAYEDLRRSGVQFPQRSPDAALIFTPPVAHPAPRYPQPGYGMPSSSTTRLDEAMAAETNISLFTINNMRGILDLLDDMLKAVDPRDCSSIKDEVIVDLVEQCRANQKKLMQCLETTGDEELLKQGLELNDHLQNVLSKHDSIASGTPLPPETTPETSKAFEKHEAPAEVNPPSVVRDNETNPLSIVPAKIDLSDDEEEDDFAKLARRHSTAGTNVATMSSVSSQVPSDSNALVPVPVYPTETPQSKYQDILDLLSLTVTTTEATTTSSTAPTSSSTTHDTNRFPRSENEFSSEAYPGHPGSYIAPWAQPPMQAPPHHPQPYSPFQPRQPDLRYQPRSDVQDEEQKPQHEIPTSSSPTYYPPPPWAPTPGYFSSQPSSQSGQPHYTSLSRPTPSIPTDERQTNSQKPFVPSYRLFEDLDVFGNTGGVRLKATTNSILGSNSNSMVGGERK